MIRYIVKKKITLTFDILANSKAEAMNKALDDSKATDYLLENYYLDEVKQ